MGDYLMSLIKCNDIQNASGGIPTVKSQQLIPTAWVNFNGSGTVAIRDSEGVSSITDVGTGIYTLNFTTNMANNDYSVAGLSQGTGFDSSTVSFHGDLLTASLPIRVRDNQNSSYKDSTTITLHVMGGQA